ncbi:hypothetical protein LVJ94_06185 [Pendulispora rubella]|uniref:Tryptophan synthase alpha chain n=1 Tax=Pendulispora rubella TaxID=2741070 RepID=A0ABZ2LC99_9BACT
MNRLVVIVVACAIVACSFTAELDPLQNGQCGSGQKSCNEHCVGLADPQTGCSLDTCAPCALTNATSRCAPNGSCSISTCRPGFENCDDNALTGCETDINFDPGNCGACGQKCVLANAVPGCSNGVCVVVACNSDWGDCDDRPENGCETRTNANDLHCGECGKSCGPNQHCTASRCVLGEGG